MARQQMVKEERSLGDLFSDLAGDTATLVRQEVSLAKVELTRSATAAGKNIGSLVVGGAIAYVAVLALTAAVILGLAQFMPAWLSALIVSAVIGVVAYISISSALSKLRQMNAVPTETIKSIKENAEWLKKEVT